MGPAEGNPRGASSIGMSEWASTRYNEEDCIRRPQLAQLLQPRPQHPETAADAAETSSCSLNSGLAIGHIQLAFGRFEKVAFLTRPPKMLFDVFV